MLGEAVPETGHTWTMGSNRLWAPEVLLDSSELGAVCSHSLSVGPRGGPWSWGFPQASLESLTEARHQPLRSAAEGAEATWRTSQA